MASRLPSSMDFLMLFSGMLGPIKGDLMDVLRSSLSMAAFIRINYMFLVLVEKRGAKDPKDFRPVSFVSSVYKIMAKVLAC